MAPFGANILREVARGEGGELLMDAGTSWAIGLLIIAAIIVIILVVIKFFWLLIVVGGLLIISYLFYTGTLHF